MSVVGSSRPVSILPFATLHPRTSLRRPTPVLVLRPPAASRLICGLCGRINSTLTEGRRAIERSYILPRPSEAPLAFLSTPAGGATGGKAAGKKRRRSMQPKAAQAFAVDSTSPVFSSTQQMVRSRHAVCSL
jgi:hypothetical protein